MREGMAKVGNGMLMYEGESPLDSEARARLKQIGHADIVVGIPSHRNGRTIGEVARAAADGIAAYLADQRVLLMNADGGSSDNTPRYISDAPVGANVEKLVTVYQGTMGKGTAIRAILEAAAQLGARACLVLEARAPGIRPEWIRALASPVLDDGYALALGCYQRSAYGAALTDNLVYPFLRTVFGTSLREPLAGEFCLSGALATEYAGRDVWETDVARFGVNIWLSTQALLEDRRICQSPLGYRGDGGGEPGMALDARFLHTMGTLFRLLSTHRRLWQKELPPRDVPYCGEPCPDRLVPCQDCVAELLDAFGDGRRQHGPQWERMFAPSTLKALLGLLEQPRETFDFAVELWTRTVMESAVVYNRGEGDPDKVVEALLPLFYARAAAYVLRTHGLSPAAREEVVQGVVQAFVESKPFLYEYWNGYQPWTDAVDTWPY